MADLTDLFKLAPTILGFLGGPAGGLAGAGIEWLADKFGASDKTKDSIQAALINADPIELRRLDYDFQKFCLANNIQVQLAQIVVNMEEAKSISLFVSGGRPAAIWVGVAGLGYTTIVEPLMRFIATVMFSYAGEYPLIDTSLTTTILMGLLGLGALRSVDKYNGVSTTKV